MSSTCKLWDKSLSHGYPQHSEHRTIYEKHKGPIPPGMMVMHTCDNPACVNPDHLVLGTAKDNYEDAKSKGRHTHGIKSNHSPLTERDVLKIRESEESTGHLAAKYGVSPMTISHIKRRLTWDHI